MNGGDGEKDAEGTSANVVIEIDEGVVDLLNIGGEVVDDEESADDGTLAARGAETGVKLIV